MFLLYPTFHPGPNLIFDTFVTFFPLLPLYSIGGHIPCLPIFVSILKTALKTFRSLLFMPSIFLTATTGTFTSATWLHPGWITSSTRYTTTSWGIHPNQGGVQMDQMLIPNPFQITRKFPREQILPSHMFPDLHKVFIGICESHLLISVLEFTRWDKKRAAQILGIHRNTLASRIKEYKLQPDMSPFHTVFNNIIPVYKEENR
jgi:hypothetical protein